MQALQLLVQQRFGRTPNHLPAIGSSEPSEDSSGLTKLHPAPNAPNAQKNTEKHCICSVQTVQFETCDCHMVVTWRLLAEAGPLAGKVPGEPQTPQACWSRTFSTRDFSQTSELVASLRSLAVSSGLRNGCPVAVQLAGTAICCCFFFEVSNGQTPSIWMPLINS